MNDTNVHSKFHYLSPYRHQISVRKYRQWSVLRKMLSSNHLHKSHTHWGGLRRPRGKPHHPFLHPQGLRKIRKVSK